MSHITTVKTQIKDLKSLAKAAERLGLEFHEGATEHRYYANKMHPCDHKLSVKGNAQAYEIGLSKSDNGYTLSYDPFQGGYGMMALVSTDGRNCNRLKQAYAVEVTKKQLRLAGHRFTEKVVDGQIHLTTCS